MMIERDRKDKENGSEERWKEFQVKLLGVYNRVLLRLKYFDLCKIFVRF